MGIFLLLQLGNVDNFVPTARKGKQTHINFDLCLQKTTFMECVTTEIARCVKNFPKMYSTDIEPMEIFFQCYISSSSKFIAH